MLFCRHSERRSRFVCRFQPVKTVNQSEALLEQCLRLSEEPRSSLRAARCRDNQKVSKINIVVPRSFGKLWERK